MDQIISREENHAIDIGSGGSTNEQGGSNNEPVPRIRQVQNLLGRVWSGVVSSDGSIKGEEVITSSYHVIRPADITIENAQMKFAEEEKVGLLDQNAVKENRKKTSPKRPPKPPRPPRGPSLDAADQKLIKEISELIMLKRARNERMKAVKKMKAAKALSSSSSNAGLFAMIFTIIFLLLFVLLPGKDSDRSFDGSPEPSLATSRGLISVQYYKNLSVGSDGSNPSSPNYIEQVPGYSPQMKQEALQDEMKYSGKDK